MIDQGQATSALPRLTQSVRQQLLDQNEGLSFQTVYRDRNFHETRIYTVQDGALTIRAQGKGPFGGSQFDTTWTADADEVHRALYNHQDRFDHTGVDPKLKLPRPDVIVGSIPEDVVEVLIDDGSPEAQSRVAAWFEGLSAKEKLLFGGVVVAVVVGGVVVYRFRRPIAGKVKDATAALRRKFDRRIIDEESSESKHLTDQGD